MPIAVPFLSAGAFLETSEGNKASNTVKPMKNNNKPACVEITFKEQTANKYSPAPISAIPRSKIWLTHFFFSEIISRRNVIKKEAIKIGK